MKHVRTRLLRDELGRLRAQVEPVFSGDTAVPGTTSSIPSAGHCAAVAAIAHAALGGELVSAIVEGQSHWFNRFVVGTSSYDADITGDQFNFEPVRIAAAGKLYPNESLRLASQLNEETLRRAHLLAKRAGLTLAAGKLAARLKARELVAA
jgi:hypothetical protein